MAEDPLTAGRAWLHLSEAQRVTFGVAGGEDALDQAIRIATSENNRGRARRLNGIKRRIDSLTARTRKTARRKDRLLDEALVIVYGLQPVR